MSVNFSDLLAALGLFLVLEGIAPFINPGGVKRGLARLLQVRDRELRIAGLGSMLVGVIILSWLGRGVCGQVRSHHRDAMGR